jgi:ribA/ribD-fused uncharacterized protein
MVIDSFREEFAFLSNFFPAPIEDFKGLVWPTSEHAFQAMKTLDPDERERIRQAPTPGKAKRLGRKATLRPDWDDVKVDVMRAILCLKFAQHSELRQKLLDTHPHKLVEGNHWHDTTWGVDSTTGLGENILGELLMLIREEIVRDILLMVCYNTLYGLR